MKRIEKIINKFPSLTESEIYLIRCNSHKYCKPKELEAILHYYTVLDISGKICNMDDELVNNIFIACEQSFNDCEDEVTHDTLLTNEIKTWLRTNGYDNIVLNVGMLHWLTDLVNSNIDC